MGCKEFEVHVQSLDQSVRISSIRQTLFEKFHLQTNGSLTESTASMRILPPLPPESVYTRCYCEENIYLLCKALSSRPEILEAWGIYVVLVSNENKTVALWSQKAGQPDHPIVWDYHVILVLKFRNQDEGGNAIDFDSPACRGSVVYDFDTTLSMPCPWEEYFSSTFCEGLPPHYQSKFRIIPGEMFVKHFASDRSHMLVKPEVGNSGALHENPDDLPLAEEPKYISPPPPYRPIRGQSAIDDGIDHNLMSHYVNMLFADDSGAYGNVYGCEEVLEFF